MLWIFRLRIYYPSSSYRAWNRWHFRNWHEWPWPHKESHRAAGNGRDVSLAWNTRGHEWAEDSEGTPVWLHKGWWVGQCQPWGMSPGNHYWEGLLYGYPVFFQVAATHLEIWHPRKYSTGSWSLNELESLNHMAGYRDGSPNDQWMMAVRGFDWNSATVAFKCIMLCLIKLCHSFMERVDIL